MKNKLFKILGVAVPLVMVLALAVALLPVNASTADAAAGTLRYGVIPLPKMGVPGKYVITPNASCGPIAIAPNGNVMFARAGSESEGASYNVTVATSNSSLMLTIAYLNQDGQANTTTATIAAGKTVGTTGTIALNEHDTGITDVTGITATTGANVTAVGTVTIIGTTTSTILATAADASDTASTITFTNGAVTTAYDSIKKSADGGKTWSLSGFYDAAVDNGDATNVVDIGVSPEYATDTTVFVATEKSVYQSVDGGTAFEPMDEPTHGAYVWGTTENVTDMDISLDAGGRVSVIIGSTTGADDTEGDVYVYSPETTGLGWQEQNITADYNVLAVAFSPNFAGDEGVFAVTANQSTQIECAFGWTKTGGGWHISGIGDGDFKDSVGADISNATRARIAFPDDFDIDSITSNVAWVGLTAGNTNGQNDTGGEYGDVYQVSFQPTASSTVDLNVRGLISTLRTATNIWDIDATGDADAATIVVGTDYWTTGVSNYYWTAYVSKDSGTTWSTARVKSPTGGATGTGTPVTGVNCYVTLSPDYATSKAIYAATSGTDTAALSRSTDSGASWNQISLIDYGNLSTYYLIRRYSPSAGWAKDMTALMVTRTSTTTATQQGSVWRTTNGGANYERILSYANPTVDSSIDQVKASTPAGTLFVIDYLQGKFWRSSDNGATFPRTINAKDSPLSEFTIVDENTIYTTFANGEVWYTTSMGRPWIAPDESQIPSGASWYTIKGNVHLVSVSGGKTYISTDSGKTFTKTLGLTDLAGTAWVMFDANYATNKYIYGVVTSAGGGVWRVVVDESNPNANEWKQIDAASDGAGTVAAVPNFQFGGILYCFDATTVVSSTDDTLRAGGIWRCVNPTAEIEGIYPPEFTKVNTGLINGDKVGFKGVAAVAPYIFFEANTGTAVNYYNQVVAYTDTLSTPVTLTAPANKATGAGIALSTTDLTMNIVLSWQAMAGATSYELQVANDSGFASLSYDDDMTGQQVTITNLIPGKKYYWRVRVNAPLLSPWSETREFSVGSAVEFKVISPEVGATGLSLQPSLSWSAYGGAISYDVVVAEDPTFAIPDWGKSVTTNFCKIDEELAYNSTYYWRVRGVTGPAVLVGKEMVAPTGPWISGMFTIMAEPVEPTPTVIVEKEPAPPAEVQIVQVPVEKTAPIPDYLLWSVIGIGAVLVIALIILIVRTRRIT